jgi:hypothetical protein
MPLPRRGRQTQRCGYGRGAHAGARRLHVQCQRAQRPTTAGRTALSSRRPLVHAVRVWKAMPRVYGCGEGTNPRRLGNAGTGKTAVVSAPPASAERASVKERDRRRSHTQKKQAEKRRRTVRAVGGNRPPTRHSHATPPSLHTCVPSPAAKKTRALNGAPGVAVGPRPAGRRRGAAPHAARSRRPARPAAAGATPPVVAPGCDGALVVSEMRVESGPVFVWGRGAPAFARRRPARDSRTTASQKLTLP